MKFPDDSTGARVNCNQLIGKAGILGGTFDPVHLGHLVVAQDVLESLALDYIFFLPTSQNPLKPAAPVATGSERLAMLELAVERIENAGILDLELKAGGINYTFDSACALQRHLPETAITWIIGADQVSDLPRWHRIDDLAEMIEFAYLDRPGYPVSLPQVPGLRLHRVAGHGMEISSSEIRASEKRSLERSSCCPSNLSGGQ